MLNLSNRTASAVRALQRAMATAVPRIGDQKVPMSLLEKGAYINYQRIEDNLAVVRERYVFFLFLFSLFSLSLASTALSRFPRKSSMAISTTLSTRTLNVAPAISSSAPTQVFPSLLLFPLTHSPQRVACQDATAQVPSSPLSFCYL